MTTDISKTKDNYVPTEVEFITKFLYRVEIVTLFTSRYPEITEELHQQRLDYEAALAHLLSVANRYIDTGFSLLDKRLYPE